MSTCSPHPDDRDLFAEIVGPLHELFREQVEVSKSAVRRHVETGALMTYGLACALLAVAYERVEDLALLIRPRKVR